MRLSHPSWGLELGLARCSAASGGSSDLPGSLRLEGLLRPRVAERAPSASGALALREEGAILSSRQLPVQPGRVPSTGGWQGPLLLLIIITRWFGRRRRPAGWHVITWARGTYKAEDHLTLTVGVGWRTRGNEQQLQTKSNLGMCCVQPLLVSTSQGIARNLSTNYRTPKKPSTTLQCSHYLP